MGWKKLIFGEKMPDKNDPKYRERYEKEVEAGRKTARFLRLDKAGAAIQRFATRRPKLFLGIVFGIVIFCLTYNMWCVARILNAPKHPVTATQVQEQMIQQKKADAEPTDTVVEAEISRINKLLKNRPMPGTDEINNTNDNEH